VHRAFDALSSDHLHSPNPYGRWVGVRDESLVHELPQHRLTALPERALRQHLDSLRSYARWVGVGYKEGAPKPPTHSIGERTHGVRVFQVGLEGAVPNTMPRQHLDISNPYVRWVGVGYE